MTPSEVSTKLLKLANYINNDPSPDRKIVANEIRHVMKSMRTAADVKQFVHKNFEDVMGGLDKLLTQLKNVMKSMNHQDPTYPEIKTKIEEFQGMQEGIEKAYQSISIQV